MPYQHLSRGVIVCLTIRTRAKASQLQNRHAGQRFYDSPGRIRSVSSNGPQDSRSNVCVDIKYVPLAVISLPQLVPVKS